MMRVCVKLGIAWLFIGVSVTTVSSLVETLESQAGSDVAAARSLINEAQQRYGRLPIGPSSVLLYQQYYDQYGFSSPSFIDICAGLVAISLARADTADELLVEFNRSLNYREGLLPVYASLAQKWGLDSSSTPKTMDDVITDPDERLLFKTALLADSVSTVWSFTLGYRYFQLTSESPPQQIPNAVSLTQLQVNDRLRNLASEGAP